MAQCPDLLPMGSETPDKQCDLEEGHEGSHEHIDSVSGITTVKTQWLNV